MGYGFNTKNNSLLGILQQTQYSIGTGNSYNSIPMTYGNNSDFALGVSVFNIFFQSAASYRAECQAEKQAEKVQYSNNASKIEEIDKQIKELENLDIDNEVKTDSNVVAKQKDFDAASKAVETNKIYLSDNKDAFDAAKKRKAKNEMKDGDGELIRKYEEALRQQDKLEKTEKTAKSELETAKTAAKTKIEKKRNDDIDDLKAKKAELQEDIDNHDLKDANGNSVTRLSDLKYDKLLGKDGLAKKNEKYSKAAVKTAVNRFMQATAPETKLKTAKNLVTMFEGCSDWNESLQKAANIAQRYINEHKA